MRFTFSTELPFSAEEVFAWHLRRGAIQRMIPPSKRVDFLFPPGSPEKEGSQVGLKVHVGPFAFRWVLQHEHVSSLSFRDVQIQGPFKKYIHEHAVIPKSPNSCILSETIEYDIACLSRYVDAEFSKLFAYRHALLWSDLELFARYPRRILRILLSGSHGLIGSHFSTLLQTAGHRVVHLVRGSGKSDADTVFWDPNRGVVSTEDFENFDAVVHLAGESIAGGVWTHARKEKIFLSRCRDTWLLSHALCRLEIPPPTVVTASAIGFYGDSGTEERDESGARGSGFLAEVCQKWEQATEAVENRGSRVVHPRFAMVLSAKGGALKPMRRAFNWGLGGRLGNGKQIVSWVGIDDAIGALYHILMEKTLAGPVNISAPHAVTQQEFAQTLAKRLHRPACFHLPECLLKLGLGEMAENVLLSSICAVPKKLLQSGYVFRYPDLKTALNHVI